MRRDILINVESQEKRLAFLQDNVLEEILIERPGVARLLGNIYKGRVENILPGIQAAFIDIGMPKNGFLHISDIADRTQTLHELLDEEIQEEETTKSGASRDKVFIEKLLKAGQEIIVQAIKEPIGSKGVRLSSNISLPGRYLVILPNSKLRGISKKIRDRGERKRLSQILKEMKVPDNIGVILRTVAEGESKRRLIGDLRYMLRLWKKIEKRIEKSPIPSCVYTELDFVLKTVRDSLTEDVDWVVLDDPDEYRRVKKFVKMFFPRLQDKIYLYNSGKTPLFEKYNIEKQLERAFNRRVWLKCGGYIVIDRTEALVAIDVNTGKHIGKKHAKDAILQTNLEAAEEVARQLKLRNIGGIIIIDFIDMDSKKNRKEVIKKLSQALKRDKAKNNILPISEIGLVEMTRERVKESLGEAIYEGCPFCRGRGSVKSSLTMSIEMQRKIRAIFTKCTATDLLVCLHSKVLANLTQEDRERIVRLAEKFKGNVTFKTSDQLKLEEIKFYSRVTGELLEP